jgi:hypothetical protein
MIKTISSKVMWVGKVTTFCVDLAVTLALILGIGTAALAAVPGDPFKLGRTNTIDQISTLVGSASGALLKVDNEGSGPALDLQVEEGEAPMKVDSSTKVTSLNADKLDGNDSSAFLGVDDQAASATNADEVDNRDANELVRVASFTGHSPLADGTNGTLATTEINAPSSGFLVINASSDFSYFGGNDLLSCFIKVDNTEASGSRRILEYNGTTNVNREQDCSTNSVVLVYAGHHTVDLKVDGSFAAGFRETALSAMYVPFDGNGAQPFVVPPDISTSHAREQGADQEQREGNR